MRHFWHLCLAALLASKPGGPPKPSPFLLFFLFFFSLQLNRPGLGLPCPRALGGVRFGCYFHLSGWMSLASAPSCREGAGRGHIQPSPCLLFSR